MKGELAKAEKKTTEATLKFESFVAYAEEKIQKANEEIAHQKKISTGMIEATTAKNKQLEIKIALLENQLQTKQSEIDRIDKVMNEFYHQPIGANTPLVS